jgi:hypothetical protein
MCLKIGESSQKRFEFAHKAGQDCVGQVFFAGQPAKLIGPDEKKPMKKPEPERFLA